MTYPLCPTCAQSLREAYTLQKLPGAISRITCAHCGARTYGSTYRLTKGGQNHG